MVGVTPTSKIMARFLTKNFERARASSHFQNHKLLNSKTTTYYYFIKIVGHLLLNANK